MRANQLIRLFCLFYLFSFSSQADTGMTIDDVSVRILDRVIMVDCDVNYQVDPKVEDALTNGVEVAFILDIELIEENKYWLNKGVGKFSYIFFIKYHALSQQYILKDKNNERSFPDLYSAFYFQSRVKNIELGNIDSLDLERKYFVRARARLASEILPLPLRIKSYFANEWRPTSGWTIWPM